MKKIPTLFERVFENHRIVGITDKVYPGMEWVLEGEGVATEKLDGSCAAIIDGVFYKRYDAKKGKKPPVGAIPCCEPDPVTGHHPHWVPVTVNPADKWFWVALENIESPILDTTYECIGPHFNGNHHHLDADVMVMHGMSVLDVPRTFEGIKQYLTDHPIEGIVFWRNGEPMCKIKRSDFGLPWGK